MGFISRLFFGKKDKQKHQEDNFPDDHIEDEEFVMQTAQKIGRENPIHDPAAIPSVPHSAPLSLPHEQRKAKKKLSSKYFGKSLVDDSPPTLDSQEEVIPPAQQPPPPQQRGRTNSSSDQKQFMKKDSSSPLIRQMSKQDTRSPSPMTITMISPPPPEQHENQENEKPQSQSHKPFIPPSHVPMVATPDVFQARGKLRNAPKRPSLVMDTSSSQETMVPQPNIPPTHQTELKKVPRNHGDSQIPKKEPQRVALKPTTATDPVSSQSNSQQPAWGRNLLKQTSQAGRLYGNQNQPIQTIRNSPIPPHASVNEEMASREQVREATRTLKQTVSLSQSNKTPLSPPSEIPDDEVSISTFGSGKGRVARTRTHSGDGMSVVSSISGDSTPHPPPGASNFLRKASTQLKLPVTISRTMTTSRVRSDQSIERNSPPGRDNSPEPREIRRSISKKRSSEINIKTEPHESVKETTKPPPAETPAVSSNLAKETSNHRKLPRQETSQSVPMTESEKVKRDKERKMKEREERERQQRLLQEEKEREDKYQKFLQEEHRRWKIKDKQYEIVENNRSKVVQRSLSERLFLNVGEKSEFVEEEEEVPEEIKVIQGTLAAELIELIEKSRARPPVVTEAKDKIAGVDAVSSKKVDTDEESAFDEDEYFREIAALSLETGDDNETPTAPKGKGILAQIKQIPNSVKNSALSKEAAKTIAKAKKIEEKKAQLGPPETETPTVVTSLLSNMVPLRIGRDEEWRQHEASLQSNRRGSSSRDTGVDRMKELIREEEKEATSVPGIPETSITRGRSMSCGRATMKRTHHADSSEFHGKKVKEMTYRERLWSRAAGSLGGVSFSSSDPVLEELKSSAEQLGETLMETQFGPYRYLDEWEGIEIFKKTKKPRQNPPVSGPATATPQHIPFASPLQRHRSATADNGTSRRGSGDEGTRLSLL